MSLAGNPSSDRGMERKKRKQYEIFIPLVNNENARKERTGVKEFQRGPTCPLSWEKISSPEWGGVRANLVTKEGVFVGPVNVKGKIFLLSHGEEKWKEFSFSEELGVCREILKVEEGKILFVFDYGLAAFALKENGKIDSFSQKVLFDSHSEERFFQTGKLTETGILVGGMNVLMEVPLDLDLEQGLKPLSLPEGMMVRAIEVGKDGEVFIGGWEGYSGWRYDKEGRLKPGKGVWMADFKKGGGIPWRQILSEINVNTLKYLPEKDVLLVGTEGAGEKNKREPREEWPSLFLLKREEGNWQAFPLELKNYSLWDVVTPGNGGIVKINEKIVFVSFWGGPVLALNMEEKSWSLLCSSDRRQWQGGKMNLYGGKIFMGGKNYHLQEAATGIVCASVDNLGRGT